MGDSSNSSVKILSLVQCKARKFGLCSKIHDFFLGLEKIVMMQLVFLNRSVDISKENTILVFKTVGQRGVDGRS